MHYRNKAWHAKRGALVVAKSTRGRENCHTTVEMCARIAQCSQGKGSDKVQVKLLLCSADIFRRVRKIAKVSY